MLELRDRKSVQFVFSKPWFSVAHTFPTARFIFWIVLHRKFITTDGTGIPMIRQPLLYAHRMIHMCAR